MTRLPLCVCLVLLALAADPDEARPTDLGPAENARIAKRFEAYKTAGRRLKASEAPRRVLVTGFGLFSGVDFNISGVVVESMADPAFWPATVDLARDLPATEATPGKGVLREDEHGARAWQRTLKINGQTYEVAFLLVDVLWDLGAAIALWESEVFQPHLIVMTGRGGTQGVFERGALNVAAPYPGFRPDGAVDAQNKPQAPTVLDPAQEGIQRSIAMTWDNKALLRAAQPVIASLERGHTLIAATEARPNNTYICNNISCGVLHGIACPTVSLAGGKIQLTPQGLRKTVAGFFHYPAASRNDTLEVRTWCRLLATVLHTHFTPPTAD